MRVFLRAFQAIEETPEFRDMQVHEVSETSLM